MADSLTSKQNGKPTRTIAEDLIQRASEMAEHVERGGLPMYGAIAREAIAEIEHLQQRVAELERDLLAALQQRNDEVRLRQAAERRSLPPNAGLLKEAADWIEQELKEIGDCDHSVGICACSSQQLLVRLRDAETKTVNVPDGTSASGNARTSDDERSDAGRIETTGVSDETGEGQ